MNRPEDWVVEQYTCDLNSKIFVCYRTNIKDADMYSLDENRKWIKIETELYARLRNGPYSMNMLSKSAKKEFFEHRGYPEADEYVAFSDLKQITAYKCHLPYGIVFILQDAIYPDHIMCFTANGWARLTQDQYKDLELGYPQIPASDEEITLLLEKHPMPTNAPVATGGHMVPNIGTPMAMDESHVDTCVLQCNQLQMELRNLLKSAQSKYPLLKLSELVFVLEVEKQIIVNHAVHRGQPNE